MPDKQGQQVDGFTDNTSEEKMASHGERAGEPGSPDPGSAKGAPRPMDPEEFARLKKEAQEENPEQKER